ncbi:MAG: hypothetical protein GX230_10505 [Lentisphaerae bacterium]|nr:hypothetical protein [Lentisphaerota bacterium]
MEEKSYRGTELMLPIGKLRDTLNTWKLWLVVGDDLSEAQRLMLPGRELTTEYKEKGKRREKGKE